MHLQASASPSAAIEATTTNIAMHVALMPFSLLNQRIGLRHGYILFVRFVAFVPFVPFLLTISIR